MITITIDDQSRAEADELPPKIENAVNNAVLALAMQAQSIAQRSILKGPKTGRMYGRHRASAPGEAPANDLGFLAANIRVDTPEKFTARLVSNAPYSIFLEYGTRNMAARPFIRPAGDAIKEKAPAVLNAFIEEALRK